MTSAFSLKRRKEDDGIGREMAIPNLVAMTVIILISLEGFKRK
jgi:hypothetical protein